jgi:hypothetical protein
MDADFATFWAERLRQAPRQGRSNQTRALLSAFSKIDDAVFREQMIILLELISSSPTLLARMKRYQLLLDEPHGNVIEFNPAR